MSKTATYNIVQKIGVFYVLVKNVGILIPIAKAACVGQVIDSLALN